MFHAQIIPRAGGSEHNGLDGERQHEKEKHLLIDCILEPLMNLEPGDWREVAGHGNASLAPSQKRSINFFDSYPRGRTTISKGRQIEQTIHHCSESRREPHYRKRLLVRKVTTMPMIPAAVPLCPVSGATSTFTAILNRPNVYAYTRERRANAGFRM